MRIDAQVTWLVIMKTHSYIYTVRPSKTDMRINEMDKDDSGGQTAP